MTTRRHALALLAATPFLSSAACASDQRPDPVAGWRSPGAGEADPRRFALAHAILAPNPHNTQPWLVEFNGADTMTLYCDLDRRLPFTDPLDRQITMGCGAFLQLYAMKVGGWEMQYFPDGAPEVGQRLDDRPIARVKNHPRLDPEDPLGAHIATRRTNRSDYTARAPSAEALVTIEQAGANWMEPGSHPFLTVRSEADPASVATIRDLVWRAFDREMRTRGAQEETYGWLRFGEEERARHRDGLYIDVPFSGMLRALGMLDREGIVNPESRASRQAAAEWRRKIDSAPAFMWMTTPDDSPTTRLLAGMAYARMNLAATAAGLAMHPWSQALQEYEEMADIYAEVKPLLGIPASETVQMLVRVGHAEAVEPAARRDMAEFVRA